MLWFLAPLHLGRVDDQVVYDGPGEEKYGIMAQWQSPVGFVVPARDYKKGICLVGALAPMGVPIGWKTLEVSEAKKLFRQIKDRDPGPQEVF
jgi:hypothetical protein